MEFRVGNSTGCICRGGSGTGYIYAHTEGYSSRIVGRVYKERCCPIEVEYGEVNHSNVQRTNSSKKS